MSLERSSVIEKITSGSEVVIIGGKLEKVPLIVTYSGSPSIVQFEAVNLSGSYVSLDELGKVTVSSSPFSFFLVSNGIPQDIVLSGFPYKLRNIENEEESEDVILLSTGIDTLRKPVERYSEEKDPRPSSLFSAPPPIPSSSPWWILGILVLLVLIAVVIVGIPRRTL